MPNNRTISSAGLRDVVPWFSIALVGLALAVSFAPGLPDLLQYDRAAVSDGHVWRLLTGQLVHWTPRMTLVDLGVVLLLGTLIERRRRGMMIFVSLAGLITTGFGIHLLAQRVTVYRGASGLATTLFVFLALTLISESRSPRKRTLAALALGLFAAKLLWESGSTGGLVAGSLPDGVEVLPFAHLLGGLAAVVLFAVSLLNRHAVTSRSIDTRYGVV